MPSLNPLWIQAARQAVNACPYFQLQSAALVDLAPGESRLAIDLATKHLQPFGLVHGGVMATLLDAAGYWAIYVDLAEGLGLTTVELKVNYLAPVVSGRLVGVGRRIKLGKSIGLAEARAEDDQGRLVAHATTTVLVLPSLPLADAPDLPPKFLEG
jgi:uncharacterized protein (TIGR00369 family)